MRIIDLTHPISVEMPVYPGTEPPIFETGCSIEETGFLEKRITLNSHTGTHVDAPAHLIKGHKTLDRLPVEQFYGKAQIINDEGHKQTIEMDVLEPHAEKLRAVELLLIHAGWSRYWGSEKYFRHYPVLLIKTAHWLSNFHLRGLGLDTISADNADTQDYPVHKAFLQKEIIIVENLTNLEDLTGDPVMFFCFPLHITEADGSPVRAVAMIE